jgi:NADH:ubiquinone oxidoreductase subunit E
MGTACFVRGAGKVLDKFARDLGCPSGTTSEDGMYTLSGLRCVGACGLAPVVIVNGKVYGRIEEKDVPDVIENFLAEVEPK